MEHWNIGTLEHKKKNFIILGIETSCDETAASLLEIKKQKDQLSFRILSKVVASQIPIHSQYGGIIPELAAREHIKKIIPVIKKSLTLNPSTIDLIAVTIGPGLITSLFIGVESAKTLAYVWQKPLMPINHLRGHIAINFIKNQPQFPALGLIVSGGHTELVLIKKYNQYRKIGQTRDDAAGECFDKVAKLLGLGYPGGPAIAKWANKSAIPVRRSFSEGGSNQQSAISLPRPMIDSNNYDFSFSGLKTAVLYLIKKYPHFKKNKKFISQVCKETQQAIIDVLIKKTLKAAQEFNVKSIILGGGVIANKELRIQFSEKIKKLKIPVKLLIPPMEFCPDNATMIVAAAYFKYINLTTKQISNLKNNWKKIKANPNLEI
ncbi:tRNA (adenosine(37)-N6)-threonylcarbamoyltransferase complex transferase subunit TsaD [bacterium]|nr:tRNA (adenosine(37)-N6)-threonylcarbamoyltransferase complex transferase subunit TsaD [bacterium]